MKLKKLIFPLVILIGLVIYLAISSDESTQSDQPFSEFTFADTASVDKVIISNTLGDEVTIQRRNESNKWKINDSGTPANKEKINRILSTIHSWKVIQNIDEKHIDGAIEQLAVKYHKIEIFIKGDEKSSNTYYIGGPNASMTGNLGLLKIKNKKSNIPYYIQIPGFYGTLETRFFCNVEDWRSSEIIALNAHQINSIQLTAHQIPEESYRLEKKLDQFSLFDGENNPIDKFDTLAARRHLIVFKTLHLEKYVSNLPQFEVDSIIKSQPLYTLNVLNNKNENTKVDVYCKVNEMSDTSLINKEIQCDPQRLYALVNNKEFVIIQVFGWGNVFKPLSFFKTE